MNDYKRIEKWSDLAVFPLVLAASVLPLLWFGRNWGVPHDGSWYLLQGWNLVSGTGYEVLGETQTVRGPVLPGVLGLLMLLLGRDTEILAWAVRLLALINPLLVYYLIKRVGRPVDGLLTAFLVAFFGYTAVSWHAFNVDAVQLLAYLLAVLAVLAAVRSKNAVISLLSGVLLGVAILTKETSLTLLPIGLFAALWLGWHARHVALHYFGVVLTCLPWWVWVWRVSGEVYLVGRVSLSLIAVALVAAGLVGSLTFGLHAYGLLNRLLANEWRRQSIGWLLILLYVAFLSIALFSVSFGNAVGVYASSRDYIADQLLVEIRLWYLLPLAGLYVLWKASSGDRLWNFYLTLLVLQVPVSLLVLTLQWGSRQWLIPQTLLYGALAVLVTEACKTVGRREVPWFGWTRLGILGLIVVVALSAVPQILYFQSPGVKMISFPPNNANTYVAETHRWIQANVPQGGEVMAASFYSEQVAFFDASRHVWKRFEASCIDRLGLCTSSTTPIKSAPAEVAWFEMSESCEHSAVSFNVLADQMESSRSEYLLVDETLPWVVPLRLTAAFESEFESRGGASALSLFKRTGRDAALVPTRMRWDSFEHLLRCERDLVDDEAEDVILSTFPNGIEVVSEGADAKLAQRTVNSIYGARSVARSGVS